MSLSNLYYLPFKTCLTRVVLAFILLSLSIIMFSLSKLTSKNMFLTILRLKVRKILDFTKHADVSEANSKPIVLENSYQLVFNSVSYKSTINYQPKKASTCEFNYTLPNKRKNYKQSLLTCSFVLKTLYCGLSKVLHWFSNISILGNPASPPPPQTGVMFKGCSWLTSFYRMIRQPVINGDLYSADKNILVNS